MNYVYDQQALAVARAELRHLNEIDTDALDGYAYRVWLFEVEHYKEVIAAAEKALAIG